MTSALETYLGELRANRSSGAATEETSGYGALANLLNTIGHTLKPKVRCVLQVKNSGAGLPDGGLFTANQIEDTDEEAPLRGIPLPSRGVMEVKAADAEVDFALLGRPLTPDEAREVTHTARRIAALILLQPELDANYLRVKANTFDS